jgi:CubicO group peptidase (beta-lactamase class C family)
MTTTARQITLLIIIMLGFMLPASAQKQEAELGIRFIMKDLDAVGMSVAVVKHNKIIYTHSFGYKDVESKTLLGDSNVFRIASISKSFSATSVMQNGRGR